MRRSTVLSIPPQLVFPAYSQSLLLLLCSIFSLSLPLLPPPPPLSAVRYCFVLVVLEEVSVPPTCLPAILHHKLKTPTHLPLSKNTDQTFGHETNLNGAETVQCLLIDGNLIDSQTHQIQTHRQYTRFSQLIKKPNSSTGKVFY